MNWTKVTAIFGGTFDPPHLGHREAVKGLYSDPGVKSVIVLPAALPPHKPGNFAPLEARIEMAKICFGANTEVSLLELERQKKTGRPSYTFETLQALAEAGYRDIAFVIGADQLRDLHTWYRFPEVLLLSHWIVLERKPEGNETGRKVMQEWENSGIVRRQTEREWQIKDSKCEMIIVPTEAPPISSTGIREAIGRTGYPPDAMLTQEVWDYIKLHRLYGSKYS